MIASFRHKGLKLLFEKDDPSKLNAEHVNRLRLILSALDAAAMIEDMDQPAFRLHPLKGDLKGYWAVTVRANWRVVFRFADGQALDIDLTDYH
ncbi:MAG: type II toxin-antitoxin system RelE/ParE family toxin [Rhodomicrobium sp.]|jgi:proteic killer suppression protein|nr:type II toxin-antitoxin system RelE/ParE family toxin [Rhodomicrobium sp.]